MRNNNCRCWLVFTVSCLCGVLSIVAFDKGGMVWPLEIHLALPRQGTPRALEMPMTICGGTAHLTTALPNDRTDLYHTSWPGDWGLHCTFVFFRELLPE